MAQKKLEYQALLEEEKLSLEDLPMEIRKRINVLRPLIAKFNQKPSDNLKNAIIKGDVEIAEMIADYIEKDLPEQNDDNDDDNSNNRNSSKNNRRNDDDDDDNGNEDDDDNDNNKNNKGNKKSAPVQKPVEKSAEEIAAEKKLADEKAEAERKAAEEKAAEEEQKKKDAAKKPITNFGNLDMEKKITENCEKNNGFISEKDLIAIIGKSPDYPNQKVFSITLKKVFMKSLYQLL